MNILLFSQRLADLLNFYENRYTLKNSISRYIFQINANIANIMYNLFK